MEEVEEPPRFTLRHLRADDLVCARRVAREIHQRRDTVRNFGASRSFDLNARLLGDIALSHAELRPATLSDFPIPMDLSSEERHVYRAAAVGYVSVFPEAFVTDPVADEWETVDTDTGLRWSARVPLAGRDIDGVSRVRHIGAGNSATALDPSTLFMLALRTEGWADTVAVDVAELLAADRLAPVIIDGDTRRAAREWAVARATRWIDIGPDPRPRAGRDCLGCAYVAACPSHSA